MEFDGLGVGGLFSSFGVPIRGFFPVAGLVGSTLFLTPTAETPY